MDYSSYTLEPQFSSSQASRVSRIKKFLGNEHSHKSKERMRAKLSALYKQRRQARAGYAKPVYGSGSMSNQQVDQQVVSGVRSKFGNEIDASPARQEQIKKYYDDWNVELQGIKDQQAQAAQAQIDAANAAQQATSSNEQSANSSLLSQMQADAAKRGASVDPSLFLKANQASANRASLGNAQTATMGALKNVGTTYYDQQGLINRASKQGALDKERSYTSRLRSDAADYATQRRGELDQASFDRALAQKSFGLKADAQKFDQNLALAKLSSTGAGSDGSSSSTGKGKGKFSPAQKTYRSLRAQTLAALKTTDPDTGKPILTGGGAAAAKFIDALIAKGADPLMAQAAVLDALQQTGQSNRRDAQLAKQIYKAYGFKIHIG